MIDDDFTRIETSFNTLGSIPVVAIFSSTVRAVAAQVQTLAGAVIGIAGLLGQLTSKERKWEDLTHKGFEHFCHGFLNGIRAGLEGILGITLIGSLGLLLYQAGSENGFKPIVKYGQLSRVAPLKTA